MANGILIIDKPPGWTSHDVVAKLRGIFRERRIGHGGPWTPWPRGCCPSSWAGLPGRWSLPPRGRRNTWYSLRLGTVTDTQDTTGTVTATHPVTADRDALAAVLPWFTGDILQIPHVLGHQAPGTEAL